jgi:hypothetical protein
MSAAFALQPTVSTAPQGDAAEDKSSPVIFYRSRFVHVSRNVQVQTRSRAQDYAKLRKNTQTRPRLRHNPRDGKARRLPTRAAAHPKGGPQAREAPRTQGIAFRVS